VLQHQSEPVAKLVSAAGSFIAQFLRTHIEKSLLLYWWLILVFCDTRREHILHVADGRRNTPTPTRPKNLPF
jgi:hypothetical protein